jgi:hypothetical protein
MISQLNTAALRWGTVVAQRSGIDGGNTLPIVHDVQRFPFERYRCPVGAVLSIDFKAADVDPFIPA